MQIQSVTHGEQAKGLDFPCPLTADAHITRRDLITERTVFFLSFFFFFEGSAGCLTTHAGQKQYVASLSYRTEKKEKKYISYLKKEFFDRIYFIQVLSMGVTFISIIATVIRLLRGIRCHSSVSGAIVVNRRQMGK